MKDAIKEVLFFLAATAIVLPTPTLIWACVTGRTIAQVLYR
jgi:hypothetical protein